MTMNPRSSGRSVRWVLAAAIAGPAVALLGSAAHAQYQVTRHPEYTDQAPDIGPVPGYSPVLREL